MGQSSSEARSTRWEFKDQHMDDCRINERQYVMILTEVTSGYRENTKEIPATLCQDEEHYRGTIIAHYTHS